MRSAHSAQYSIIIDRITQSALGTYNKHLIIAVNGVVLTVVYIHYTLYIYYNIVLRILHTQMRKELFAEIHALAESFRGQQSRGTNFFIGKVVEMYYNFRNGGKRLHVSLFIYKHETFSLILV